MNSDGAVTSIFRINIWYRHQYKKEAKGKKGKERHGTGRTARYWKGKYSISRVRGMYETW